MKRKLVQWQQVFYLNGKFATFHKIYKSWKQPFESINGKEKKNNK